MVKPCNTDVAREFDVIVYGATGFTGRLVAQYLAEAKSAAGVSWALCGRRKEALEQVADACGAKGGAKPLVFVADSSNAEQLDVVCRMTKVVIACAGPFTKVGMPLAESCVRCGTHYVDITGEPAFVRKLVETLHDKAVANEVLLLPCSGFDSVPSDVANAYAFELAAEAKEKVTHVGAAFRLGGKGGVSRGTLESCLLVAKTLSLTDLHPNSLVPKDQRGKVATPMTKLPWYNAHLRSLVGPYFMAATNERVVRRANYLSAEPRKSASYVEMYKGGVIEVVFMVLFHFIFVLAFVPFAPTLLRRFVFPAPGEGPTEKKSSFTADAMAFRDRQDVKPVVHGRVKSNVGVYRFTAIAAAETALAVAKGETDPGSAKGGVRTAGCTVFRALKKRLEASGHCNFESVTVRK
jgi:short subunit dehydrogenase-like uncharacterized protein